jgi:hypothetical protein
MHARRLLPLLSLVAVLAGCASGTQLSDRWRDPSYTAGPARKVYVVAIRNDAVRRRMWEDAYVSQLKARGADATASYTQFPDAAPDTQQVADVVGGGAYDAVLIAMRLPTTTALREVPPTTTRVAETRRNPFTGFYYTVYRDVYTPGYTETDEVRRFQTDVWTTQGGGRLVWSTSLDMYDPATGDAARDVVSKKVLKTAAKDGVLP